jgi:hypothetical protein
MMPFAFWQITTEALQVGWLLAGLGALAAGLGIFRAGFSLGRAAGRFSETFESLTAKHLEGQERLIQIGEKLVPAATALLNVQDTQEHIRISIASLAADQEDMRDSIRSLRAHPDHG